jgi:hypothetical protein
MLRKLIEWSLTRRSMVLAVLVLFLGAGRDGDATLSKALC